ncbi:PAAR-like domain-containing protein [Sorangium sp. So ce1014]|uniref:PAAR-like domain-containing protein n=1 Tax=Sorangium sp. So ce1014 TaxID=3133326 RepID=UPI003F635CF0
MPLVNQKKLVASVASGHVAVSQGPNDVCKTPAPPAPAPVPLPYPNVAVSATMGPGYTTKTLVMATPMWTKNGKTAISNGDQPGVALGVVSSKIMGMCEITMASNDVNAEGGAVVRTLDSSLSNG